MVSSLSLEDLPIRVRNAALALGCPERRIEHISDLEWLKRKNFGRKSLVALRELVPYVDPTHIARCHSHLVKRQVEFAAAKAALADAEAELVAAEAGFAPFAFDTPTKTDEAEQR